jgi:NTP pyrophosphatase (non-canonical NTP hydrolase)
MTAHSDGSFGFGTESWPGAAKLLEEMGEVIQVLGKLIVNGGSTDYWGDRDLHQLFIEELGDLQATLIFFREENFSLEDIRDMWARTDDKLTKYATWKGRRVDEDETV